MKMAECSFLGLIPGKQNVILMQKNSVEEREETYV